MEVQPLQHHLKQQWIESPEDLFTKGNCSVEILISGIGMHRMAFAMGQQLAQARPDFCINVGIAGAFPGKAIIGEVVHITSEIIADLGAEDANGSFLSLSELDLYEELSSTEGLVNHNADKYDFLRKAKGISTNCTHGSASSIQQVVNRWDPDVESMEGAAFFYACMKTNVPFVEIRAISNIVEPRNKDNWNIPMAVERLNAQLIEMIEFFI